ncbi:hypothetical protein VNO77_23260 [Canavalia gladiata]|uniref:Uncharacterized protein n=1 Tax=Canavalia gladiata TaxID=3824 RepID=A0AAN9L4M3_CANGL
MLGFDPRTKQTPMELSVSSELRLSDFRGRNFYCEPKSAINGPLKSILDQKFMSRNFVLTIEYKRWQISDSAATVETSRYPETLIGTPYSLPAQHVFGSVKECYSSSDITSPWQTCYNPQLTQPTIQASINHHRSKKQEKTVITTRI